jgi:phage-related protein
MGGRPVKEYLDRLTDEEAAEIVAATKEVARDGLRAARHLRGDIYEVRAFCESRDFRILFSAEGRYGQVLLALVAFAKQTQRTPKREIDLAESRLKDWRNRGGKRQ